MGTTSDLKSSGLKATLPRLRILNLFETSPVRHLSADDVYRMLMQESVDIGLATVYRVLTQFEQAGLLRRHHFESGKAVFELNQGGHHDHIVCLQCGHVEEFFHPEIERLQDEIARERGFSVQQHSMALYADCLRTDCPELHALRVVTRARRALLRDETTGARPAAAARLVGRGVPAG